MPAIQVKLKAGQTTGRGSNNHGATRDAAATEYRRLRSLSKLAPAAFDEACKVRMSTTIAPTPGWGGWIAVARAVLATAQAAPTQVTAGELVAVDTDPVGANLGAIVFWSLSGEVDLQKLEAAWAADTLLDEEWLPAALRPKRALGLAVKQQAKGRLLARPLDGAKGWVLVREAETGDEDTPLEHRCEARFWLEPQGGPGVGLKVAWAPDEHAAGLKVAAEFSRLAAGTLAPANFSPWLSDTARDVCKGVSLRASGDRDSGGVYYLAPEGRALWDRITTALHASTTHHYVAVPAAPAADLVPAILAGLGHETQALADGLAAKLDAHLEAVQAKGDAATSADKRLGARAFKSARAVAEAQLSKLSCYESLLEQGLPGLVERLQDLQAALGEAALADQALREEAREEA